MPEVKREERQAKRQRILESAVQTFARKGFYNTKVSEIAKSAGVADGTIYLYFKNKDDILVSLFEESMGDIIDEFKQNLSVLTDPIIRIKSFISLHFDFIRNHPDLAAVLQLELRQSNQFLKEYSGSKISEYLNLIADIIEAGQGAGVFRDDVPPVVFKHALFGALDEMSTLWVLSKNRSYDLSDTADQIVKLFLNGMLAANGNQQLG